MDQEVRVMLASSIDPSPTVKLVPTPLSVQERDRRYAALRERMAARDLDFILVPHSTGDWDNFQPDLRYLSCIGGGGMAAALVFPANGKPIAAVRESRRTAWWRHSQGWIDDIRSPPQFTWSRFFIQALRDLGASERTRIGIVGLRSVLRDPEGIMSHGEFTALQAEFPNASFECATDVLYAVRKRKSAEEIALIEKAQGCADAIEQAFRESLRPGMREHEVYAHLFAAHIRAGGEAPSMILFNADNRFYQTQLLPTFRCLEQGDAVVVEAEPKFYGYMAQAILSASLRPLSDLEARLFAASQTCFEVLMTELRPGRSYKDLINVWTLLAKREGVVAGRTMGHGLGLGQDPPLTVPAGDGGSLLVEEGDVLVLKPWVSNEEDTVSVRVGGTVVVGATSPKKLGKCGLMPFVVG
jgi:Xaa-Pro dipeptidase